MRRAFRWGLALTGVSALAMGFGAPEVRANGTTVAWLPQVQGAASDATPITWDLPAAGRTPTPFAQPDLPPFDGPGPLPPIDVTGSIGSSQPETLPATASTAEPDHGSLRPQGTAVPMPDGVGTSTIAIPVPEPPAQVVVDPRPPLPLASPEGPLALAPSDIAEALKSFVTPEPVRRPGETAVQARQRLKDRVAIAAAYAAHANAPLWIEGDHFSTAARAALSQIDRAGEDGLGLAAYAVPALSAPDKPRLVAAELALSEAAVAYARQASGSRIDPLQIDRLITAKPTVAIPSEVLATVPVAPDPAIALRGYNPPQPGYAALRDKLAELRQAKPMALESIPSGPTLKLGMRDARVPLIRSRFGLDLPSAEADADGLVYDTRVAAAVADFQRTNGLPASGSLTPKTIAALSGGNPSRLENELIANMERWRWVPRDLGADHIAVNIPDYSLDVIKGGQVVHHARVVVGKPDHQTPVFSDLMRFVIVNPYWNVPLSIINKEMMPKLAQDPGYFANHGYEVVERDGTTYVRQPPGEDNALGRIKFMFPNQHAVYLHDTNARALFGKERRAFSHGCVRVDQPFKLAEVVLGAENGWTEKRVKKLIGGDERTINLPAPLPIHILYFTAFVGQDGGLELRDDVYGYSARVKLALGLRE